jgi:hypothetical protein
MEPRAIETASCAGRLQPEEPYAVAHHGRRDAVTGIESVDTYASASIVAKDDVDPTLA